MSESTRVQDCHILIVEDEAALSKLASTVLHKEGFNHVAWAANAEEALAYCQVHRVDCVILDVMLPGKSGFDIAPFLRMHTDAPIIFVTARMSDLDKLTGFALGGDDYMTKPYHPLELAARVKAQLKRYMQAKGHESGEIPRVQGDSSASAHEQQANAANRSGGGNAPNTRNQVYDYGRFVVDEAAGELLVEGKSVDCPAMVFQLLLFFCKHPNRLFQKSELYERVWGLDAVSDDNTVMVHIHRIRERIEQDPSNPAVIVTVRGLGYKLVHKPE